MKIEQITLQSKIQEMESSQEQDYQHRSDDGRNKELLTDHKRPSPPKRFSSHCVKLWYVLCLKQFTYLSYYYP